LTDADIMSFLVVFGCQNTLMKESASLSDSTSFSSNIPVGKLDTLSLASILS